MIEKSTQKPIYAFILAFVGVIFFSSKAVMVKLAYRYEVDALSLLSFRLLFALPVYILVILGTTQKSTLKAISAKDYSKIIVLGLFGYYVASYLDFLGLSYISASLERLILFVYPTIVLILSSILFGKKASNKQKLAVAITYLGILLAFYQNTNSTGEHMLLGVFLIFFSAISYALYLIGSGNLIPIFGAKLFTSIAMTVAALAATIHFVLLNGLDLFSFPKEVYLLALAMSVISTIIPSFLISEAIRIIGPSNVAIIGSFGPISTIILATVFLDEKLSVYQLLGTIIVISGIVLLAAKKEKL